MVNEELYRRLRALSGRRALIDGIEWCVCEILPDEDALVLRRTTAGETPIQTNAYGGASRRAPETWLVRYTDAQGDLTEEARTVLSALQPA